MRAKHIVIQLLLLLSCNVFAQEKFSISGTIKDKKNGEELIGSIVSIPELKGVGVAANTYGFYSLTLAKGTYTVRVSTLGFKAYTQTIELNKNIKLDVALEEDIALLNVVEVKADGQDKNVREAQMGVEKLDMLEINKIPVLLGEKDILKTIQLLPGIKSSGEGNSGFNVRGGATDQNLILLDEAPVYNASHLLGFFSTFNSDAIKDAQIYKGGMPSQYGGRLSSVLDIKMKEGNNQKFGASGGIGVISSRLNIEGPIKKDKGSFLITGRRTYLDQFLKLSPTFKDNGLFFYDANIKANYQMNDKNRVFLSGYFGRDVIKIGSNFGISWGNTTGTLRWNHIINSKWFSNTSAIYSNYDYNISAKAGANEVDIKSVIKDYNVKQEFNFFPNPRNNFKLGVNVIYHTIVPGQIKVNEGSSFKPLKLQDKYALENAIYVSNDWKPLEKLSFVYGVRLSTFTALGKGNFYTYTYAGEVKDTTSYKVGAIVKNYIIPEPRLAASYVLSETNSVKAAYSRNAQYLHLISNSTSGNPTDLWIPTSINVKPEIADQVSLGYFQNFKNNKYELSAEVYYKNMQNQIDYRNGANTQANEKIEGELLYGKGRAYGLELLFKKKAGKFTGWLGYTLSRTERKINGINNSNWYAAKQDRTHDISMVGMYELSIKWDVSATWVYNTGNAVTFPSGKYVVDNQVQFLYTERNGYRMPSYHRLDFGATWHGKKTKRYESSWNFSIYNAYARANAYTITFEQDPNDATKTQAVRTALFKLVPSVTYNFKF
jgi:hypothetical protein